jgi:hypothetical protein
MPAVVLSVLLVLLMPFAAASILRRRSLGPQFLSAPFYIGNPGGICGLGNSLQGGVLSQTHSGSRQQCNQENRFALHATSFCEGMAPSIAIFDIA